MPQISTHQRCCLDTRRPLEFWAMVSLNISVLDFGGHRESIRGAWDGGHPPPKKYHNQKIFKKFRKLGNFAISQFGHSAIWQFWNFAISQFRNSQFHNLEILRNANAQVHNLNISNVYSLVPMCTVKFQCVQYSCNVFSIVLMCTCTV